MNRELKRPIGKGLILAYMTGRVFIQQRWYVKTSQGDQGKEQKERDLEQDENKPNRKREL